MDSHITFNAIDIYGGFTTMFKVKPFSPITNVTRAISEQRGLMDAALLVDGQRIMDITLSREVLAERIVVILLIVE